MADGSQDFDRMAVVTSPPLTCRAYLAGDLEKVAAREDMAAELAQAGAAILDVAVLAATITKGTHAEAEPLACGFVEYLGDGHYGLVALVSAMTPRQWVFATQMLRSIIRILEGRRFARSVRALVRADFAAGIRYLERFGFVAQSASVVGEGPLYVTMIRRR